jgi:hypothetical protein
MPRQTWPALAAAVIVVAASGIARAGEEEPAASPAYQRGAADSSEHPVKLMLQPLQQDQSVYALPAPPTENEGANTGGINLDVTIRYLSDYLYRGVDRTNFIGAVTNSKLEERADFQFDGVLKFNLGKLPHPFIGIFANVLDEDPVQTFQEVRPIFGAEWRIRPLVLSGGFNSYIFPDRSQLLNTSEVWGKIQLDDSVLLGREEPLLSPYVYAAYDLDKYQGWYFEAGVSHDFVIENTGITLTFQAAVGAVLGQGSFAGEPEHPGDKPDDNGFQHYEFGLIGRYSLNHLFNIPQRFGQWSINGYLYYSDGLENTLRADTALWGGAGIQLQY